MKPHAIPFQSLGIDAAIGSAPLEQHTIQRRLQAKMLHAVATAFEEPRHLSTHGDK